MRNYEIPDRLCENRLPQRSFYIPEGAQTLLNGVWDFAYYSADYDTTPAKEGSIDVPSCWQFRGIEPPYYSNVIYPFPYDPPYVPTENPMVVYTRSFELAEDGRRQYIVFEGVSSCLELFINGAYVGYSQGSHMQAEFDITDKVHAGTNTVTAKVRKYCSGSYLEDQDFFRNNGIFRDVYLLSRPEGHIVDIDVRAEGDSIVIRFDGDAEISLFAPDGELLEKKQAEGNAVFTVENPLRWNAEQPYLYELQFASHGESIRQKLGFVRYGVNSEGAFTVNGVPVKLKGVNHHDNDPRNGYTMSLADVERDLLLMKKLNINCIRTSHYPPMPQLPELCDRLGFYLVLEADLETHGISFRYAGGTGYDCLHSNPEWLGNQKQWLPAYLDRIERAYGRDKNHCCIFAWSTGNESGHCDNHAEMMAWLRQHDDRRFVHVEDCSRAVDNPDPKLRAPEYYAREDIHSKMYPPVEELAEYASDKDRPHPYFMCEYGHAMGNGPGGIADYWEQIDRSPKLIGGCIWEWAEHVYLDGDIPLYGGDFGELTSDYNFCADGLVGYDRRLKAGSLNVKYNYQYLGFRTEGSALVITNRHDFIGTEGYTIRVQTTCDGAVVSETVLSPALRPQEELRLPITLPERCTLGAFVVCRAYKDGELAALWETELPVEREERRRCDSPASVTESEKGYTVRVGDSETVISRHTGLPVSLVRGGVEQLAEPARLSVWRAPTDNDGTIRALWGHPDPYNGENYDRIANHVYSAALDGNVLRFTGSLAGIGRAPFLHYTLTYTFTDDGATDVDISCRRRENSCWLPRFGFEFVLSGIRPFRYFGRGPEENYGDMRSHVTTGYFDSDPEREYVRYVRPQEHGNHTGCRSLAFENGPRFEADRAFETAVSLYSAEMLTACEHIDELSADGNTHLRIDYKNSGLGTNSCGPELPEQYRLSEKEFSFRFTIL